MSAITTRITAEPDTTRRERACGAVHRSALPRTRDASLPRPPHVCETCGRAACVHVLEGYDQGRRVVRRFCLDCVDRAAPWRGATSPVGLRPGLPALGALCGAALLGLGLFGDLLVPERHSGFGLYQQTGVVLAAVVVLVGVLLRAGPLAVAGLFLLGGAIGADWFGLVSGPGVGWKQQLMIASGLVLIAGGLVVRQFHRRQRAARGRGAAPTLVTQAAVCGDSRA